MRLIFELFPHNDLRDGLAQFLITNALASTWIFAAVFYFYWRIDDERTKWRRSQLIEVFIAFCFALIITLAWRPWIAWPAPDLVPRFRPFYPEYFWTEGNQNCFPSHSTLIYLIVAAGLWPFKRWASGLLIFWVLVAISFPRIYVGGHYPIDVLAAIALTPVALWMARRICSTERVSFIVNAIVSERTMPLELFLFLWLFELGEGFRSSYYIALNLARAVKVIL